jgi:hypothetical protein
VVGTAGPCCGEPGNAGYPCAPVSVLGGEDGALARRPQAPLESISAETSHTARSPLSPLPRRPATATAASQALGMDGQRTVMTTESSSACQQ